MEDEERMFASGVHIWLVTAEHGLVSTAAVPPATASWLSSCQQALCVAAAIQPAAYKHKALSKR